MASREDRSRAIQGHRSPFPFPAGTCCSAGLDAAHPESADNLGPSVPGYRLSSRFRGCFSRKPGGRSGPAPSKKGGGVRRCARPSEEEDSYGIDFLCQFASISRSYKSRRDRASREKPDVLCPGNRIAAAVLGTLYRWLVPLPRRTLGLADQGQTRFSSRNGSLLATWSTRRVPETELALTHLTGMRIIV